MQEHTTTESKTKKCEGEKYQSNANNAHTNLNKDDSEDSVVIKVVVDKNGVVEDVVQEIISDSYLEGYSATPANGQISQIDQGSDKGEGLLTLSHERVSQTLALIDLPNMGTSPGTMVGSPQVTRWFHKTYWKSQKLYSKLQLPYPPHAPSTCGKKLLEILNKNDTSDPLLHLLDSPKLFNGQIWTFVNYTEQEISSWETETPVTRPKRKRNAPTNPVCS